MVLHMSKLVLNRTIKILYNDFISEFCRVQTASEIVCSLPDRLLHPGILSLSLQLWPRGPFQAVEQTLVIVRWP